MVATVSQFTPISYKPGRASSEERSTLPELVNRHVHECLAESAGWRAEARLSHRYYRSDQYRKYANSKDRNRIRLVANFIRRDVDLMVAELLDGEPVVNPSGRNPKHFELGRLLLQVLQWTRDEEDDWEQDVEAVITDAVHIGEGVFYEGWDQDADQGHGLPTAKRLDSRYVFWDYAATEPQRDDADYIIWLERKPVSQIEEMWPQLKGEVGTETAETFLAPSEQQYYRAHLGATSYNTLFGQGTGSEPWAWIRRQWSKKHKWRRRYWDRETWESVMVPDLENGDERRMEERDYAQLDPEEREGIYEARVPYHELWETVVVGDTLVDHRLSPFDESNGGHGRYPFAFVSCNILADESHARGEIGFLIQVQDITNEAITQYLNQLFLLNVGYLHSYKGSVDPDQEEKIPLIGRDPVLHIQSIPGFEPPSFRGMNPTGMQAAAAAIPMLKNVIMDSMSGIHRVDRGESESSGQSGRAIRALQARTSLLSAKLVRHVESGLKRCTLLRLHNIMQFMRGNRVLQVTDPDTERGEKTLIIGHDEQEMVAYHRLRVEKTEDNSVIFKFPDGTEAELLVLNDDVARNIVFEQVRLKLDTGQEKNRLERQEDAREVLRTVGPAGIAWAARQLDWADSELLLGDIKKHDMGQQIMAQLEEIKTQTGMDIPSIMQLLAQTIQQQVQAAEMAGAGAPGPPSPGAMPMGVPGGGATPPGGPAPPRRVRPVRPPGGNGSAPPRPGPTPQPQPEEVF